VQVANLRGVAAEVAVLKEQADRYKKQWQEAEQRLMEAQVRSVHHHHHHQCLCCRFFFVGCD
jgi:hypothetical protein